MVQHILLIIFIISAFLHFTLAECKSGYGLVTEHEIKMLKVLQRVKKEVPLDIVMNLLAAHSVPEGYTAEEATEMIVKEMIPAVIALKKAGIIKQGVDDNNVYGDGTVEATKQVQRAAKITIDGLAGSKTIRACYVLLAKKI